MVVFFSLLVCSVCCKDGKHLKFSVDFSEAESDEWVVFVFQWASEASCACAAHISPLQRLLDVGLCLYVQRAAVRLRCRTVRVETRTAAKQNDFSTLMVQKQIYSQALGCPLRMNCVRSDIPKTERRQREFGIDMTRANMVKIFLDHL